MNIATPLLALVLACSQAAPALALSCARPDVRQSYASAAASEETYIILSGRFTPVSGTMPGPNPDLSNPDPVPASVATVFSGRQLAADGRFAGPVERDVMLLQQCLGPWCGTMEADVETLAFVRVTAEGLVLDLNPCGLWHFFQPDEATIAEVADCMTSGDCG